MKTIHVVTNKKVNSASIGRAFDAGMRVPDISVSWYHATIEFKNNNFFLIDNQSKFGTLILIRKPLVIDPRVFLNTDGKYKNKELFVEIEVGRTVIKISCQ